MVAPQTSAQLDGAVNIALVGIGHNALVASRRVFALVAEELQRVERGRAVAAPLSAASASPIVATAVVGRCRRYALLAPFGPRRSRRYQ